MQRTTSLLLTGAMSLGTVAVLSAIAPGVASAQGCGNTVVTNTDHKGWQIPGADTTAGATVTFAEGSGIDLQVPDGGRAHAVYPISVDGVPLASQTAQSEYAVLGDTSTTGFSYQLTVDYNGAATGGFTTLVYEDVYQQANPNTWYSTRPLDKIPDRGGHGRPDFGTLDEISSAYPDAVIQAFAVQLGSGRPAATAHVDKVTFGCNTFTFEISNRAPVAAFSYDDNSDTDYRTYWFNGAGSTDPDKDALTYSWSFGDGTSAAAGAQLTHTFPKGSGTYSVALTVTDPDGLSSTSAPQTVTVAPPTNTEAVIKLPNTGANVLGLAAISGLVLVGGSAGLVATRRRRPGAHAA